MAVPSWSLSLRFSALPPNPKSAVHHNYIDNQLGQPLRTGPSLGLNQSSKKRRAIEEGQEEKVILDESSSSKEESGEKRSLELGSKMKEMKKDDLWSGVAEEIREIEWPAFRKVVGITGVVLGVIAGSSVVLLTVNAILAELSDGLFAGKGVQDFFG